MQIPTIGVKFESIWDNLLSVASEAFQFNRIEFAIAFVDFLFNFQSFEAKDLEPSSEKI